MHTTTTSRIPRSASRISAALFLLALQPFSPSAFSSAQPDYSLGGIVQPAKTPTTTAPDEFAATIASAQVIYAGDNPSLRAALATRDRLKLPTRILVYTGGYTTNENVDLAALERDYRSGIAMTPVARLATPIDATATRLTLTDPEGNEFAIKPATATHSETKNPAKYDSWIRIDDELMRVTAVENTNTPGSAGHQPGPITITVERGYAKTTPAPHAARARLLGPVYQGNRAEMAAARHSNSWPGGPDSLFYTMDPGQPAAQKFKAAIIADIMRRGYDGAWLDTFQLNAFNICDALGRKLTFPWDFKTNKPYTPETWLSAFKDYLRGLRATVRAATGREPVLYANNVSGAYANGAKQLFNHGDTRDLLDGYSFEDSYLLPHATRDKKGGKAQSTFEPITGAKWLRNVTNQADAARSGLHAYCMSGPAGYVSQFLAPTQPNYPQLLRYAYASFLLTVTKERTTMFGWPVHITVKNGAPGIVPWPRLFYAGIGDPAQPNDIPALKLPNTPCYQRRFQNALVLVNPATDPVTIPIPPGCTDALTGTPIPTPLHLPPADAAILLRKN